MLTGSWKPLGELDEQDEEQEGGNGYEDQDIEMGEHEAKNGHSEPRTPRRQVRPRTSVSRLLENMLAALSSEPMDLPQLYLCG
jgi:hypothetical protein